MKLHKFACVMLGAGFLSACATKAPMPSDTTTPVVSAPAKEAKDALAQAVKSQLYRSFGFQTDVYLSNKPAQLDNADSTSAPISAQSCNKKHDDDYVALLKKAHSKHGKKVKLKTQYPSELDAIKSAYQACLLEVDGTKGKYTPFDFDAFYQESHDLSAEQRADYFLGSAGGHLAVQASLESQTDDNKDPALEAKKAKLLEAYLLKPTHLSMSGRYHPLKGEFRALPVVQYNAKNLHLSVNQPIHVDLKAGGIYLWADNFALANSQFLDKRLGDKWQNKWLFLPLNDGSLPEGFAKDLGRAYLNAKKESFVAMPSSGFLWTDATNLKTMEHLADNVPSEVMSVMTNTPYIIKQQLSAKDKEYSDYVFYEVLYNTITKKYPEFAIEQVLGNPNTTERDIVDGESVITVRNADESSQTPSEPKVNAKMFITLWLSGVNQKVQNYYIMQSQKVQEGIQEGASEPSAVTHYGLEGNRLSWVAQRHYLDKRLQGGQFSATDQPMVIDVFTKIYQDPSQVKGFDGLPAPSADNSVNLLTYKDEFIQHLKNSDDEYLQTMLGLILGQEAEEAKEAKPDDADNPTTE